MSDATPAGRLEMKSLIDHIDRKLDEVRNADLDDGQEIERARAVKTLESAKGVVRALCMSDSPEMDFVIFCQQKLD